ncbi:hypothetical protein P8629_02660 [Hydrogenovibrio sp. 3SP14C1]|uniref:hypothetical protein n=1 Tax=Hydrogenovibrio sp. 3SP14C1 TaxID=3038774 RepID=UPI0024177598|nr:hypothetical protein [Hydrogenovibrio sp. 3SP14C1]MDG4811898.1 hypothetical protein [Hydrogenovibrio sp. 3SP14C1]
MRDLNEWAQEIHANNIAAGWWEGEPCIYTKMQLISTEIAEATKGERKDLMDDKLPHRKMGEVELADALIRTLDLGGYLGLKYDFYPKWSVVSEDWTIGRKHLFLNRMLILFSDSTLREQEMWYSSLVKNLIQVSDQQGYDIESAMIEKLEFNKTRPDHQPENRAKAHGKKF